MSEIDVNLIGTKYRQLHTVNIIVDAYLADLIGVLKQIGIAEEVIPPGSSAKEVTIVFKNIDDLIKLDKF